MDEDNPGKSDDASLERLVNILWIGILVGLISLTIANAKNILAAVGIGVLIFLASFIVGAFLGFLFGVPRILSREQSAPATGAPGAPNPPAPNNPPQNPPAGPAPPVINGPVSGAGLLQSNTNLERISDWLTTLLVGATLVQIHKINDGLVMFREFLETSARVFVEPGVAPHAGALPIIGPIVLIFGITCGFLYMYLNTRLVLVRLFYKIEDLIHGGGLGKQEQLVVKTIAQEGTAGSFLRNVLTSKRKLTVQDGLSLMFDLLYKADPERVINLGAELSTTPAIQRADYWFYLAAAFGQMLHRLGKGTQEWDSNRDNALDSARRAVSIDASYRERLWHISNPDSSDNDLAPLRDDPDFLKIVGRSAR